MCYRCENIKAIVSLAQAAAVFENVAGAEQAQKAIGFVVNEIATQFANDLADERKAEEAASVKVQNQTAEASCGQATEPQNENGSGEVEGKQLPPELAALLAFLTTRNPLKA